MGLDEASSVSATFGNLMHSAGPEYLRALSEIMKRFPNHVHLFAGPGSVKRIRSFLHSEGVLPRVRFLGNMNDAAPLLDMIDVYLAPFPDSVSTFILDAMGAGRPVVALRNAGAELVGVRELTAPGAADYIEIADRLLRNPSMRAERAEAALKRFQDEFSSPRLGERYSAFLARLASDPRHLW
jgi:glycosyltransferase involved in cell wall biosynthesis